ncbi:MAG: NAD(P)-dependent oxidoreductase [Desulfobulbus sp.]|nr:NAD(P)-dependent oxidoreductase [Desulfobulbus sp.]
MMNYALPGVLLTGASGFVGRNFIKAASGRYRLFCVARRSMEEAGVQADANLRWIQVDIAEKERLQSLLHRVRGHGGVDYVVNLAGYYDFTNQDHPEYNRTNIEGTRNMLEIARELAVKRFVFASSQAACPFGPVITESTPPDAPIAYARSKRAGEELLRAYAPTVPGAIVRIAAVFSDWCEYPPLYTLLNSWCSGKWLESRMLAGRGRSALPYVHVQDLVQCFLKILEKSDQLEPLCVFNAGPDGTVSHAELFRIATQFYYNKTLKPFYVPRWLLAPMILLRRLQRRLQGKEAFEQLWMARYIDERLVADSSQTRRILGWRPTPRKSITRRLVFLIENMKRNPELWRQWNEAMLHKETSRPHLALHALLCESLESAREEVVTSITEQLLSRDEVVREMTAQLLDSEQPQGYAGCIRALEAMPQPVAVSFLRLLYQLILTVMRTRNRPMMQQYAHTIAFLPMSAGIAPGMASRSLFILGEYLIQRYRGRTLFERVTPRADDYITMTIHMAIDRIEDQMELARLQSPNLLEELGAMTPPLDNSELEKVVAKLKQLCSEAASGQSWTSPLLQE